MPWQQQPHATLRSAATLMACALKLGTSLVAGLVAEEAHPGTCTGPAAVATERLAESREAEIAASLLGRKLGLQKSGSAVTSSSGLVLQKRGSLCALDAADVLADVCGDGEVCWERLAGLLGHHPLLAVELLTRQGEAQAAACVGVPHAGAAESVAHVGQMQQWAGWLVQLMQVEAGGGARSVGVEVQEVVAQSVGLRLLLSTLRALRAS